MTLLNTQHFYLMALVLLLGCGEAKPEPLSASASELAACAANPWGIRVGAIRWDAWYGSGLDTSANSTNRKVVSSLGPTQYWSRLPFFAEVRNNALVAMNGNKQSLMDAEIQYAERAGVDYWAFLEYPKGSGLEIALSLYLASAKAPNVRFSLILNQWSYNQALAPGNTAAYLDSLTEKVTDSRYETVLAGRPLIYVYDDICSTENVSKYCSPWLFSELSARVQKRRGVKPYYVYLATVGSPHSKYLGMNAISAYAISPAALSYGLTAEAPFAKFASSVREGFNGAIRSEAEKIGLDMVPFATAGWDPSPRLNCANTGADCWQNAYGSNHSRSVGTGIEIADHVARVAELTAFHGVPQPSFGFQRAMSPAKTMLIYAWNEFDEGGWLAPTLASDLKSPNTDRIEQVRVKLRPCK